MTNEDEPMFAADLTANGNLADNLKKARERRWPNKERNGGNGIVKKICCHCDKPSVPSLKKGIALCQYHFNVVMYGKAWADKCRAETVRQIRAKEHSAP